MTDPKPAELGLLLAMMEPVSAAEEEFNDWYDTEHQPKRAAIPGILNARRFVCIDGWPRYLAIYDLENISVLRSDTYVNASYQGFSNWGKRVLSRVLGQFRGEAVQIYPGTAMFGDRGPCSRLFFWRFRQPPDAVVPAIYEGLRKLYGDRPEVAQFRLFRSDYDNDTVYIGLIEARVPMALPEPTALAAFGEALAYVDAVNTYVPYNRPGKLHGIQR